MKLYGAYTTFENAAYLLRPVEEGDAADLLEVYGDKNALPFFNSDNCDGDNFYYPPLERVAEAIRFWQWSYANLVRKMDDRGQGRREGYRDRGALPPRIGGRL